MFQMNGKYLRRLSFEIGYVVGQEEGGIVHPSEINCHLMFLDWENIIENDLLC